MSEATDPFQTPKVIEGPPVPQFEGSDEAIRKAHLKHEASIQGVGSLYGLGGLFGAIGGLGILIMGVSASDNAGVVMGTAAVYLLFSSGSLWLGFSLRALKPGARIPGIVVAAIGLIGFPIGTLISIYAIYLLASKKGGFILSEEYRAIKARTPHIKYRTPLLVWIMLALIFGALALMVMTTYLKA